MNLSVLPGEYAVCRLGPHVPLPDFKESVFLSITRTQDETSIVCESDAIPDGVECEADWKLLGVEGPLDFDLIGILAAIATPLARAEVSVFAISTFETDYVLVRSRDLEKALETLEDAGHKIIPD